MSGSAWQQRRRIRRSGEKPCRQAVGLLPPSSDGEQRGTSDVAFAQSRSREQNIATCWACAARLGKGLDATVGDCGDGRVNRRGCLERLGNYHVMDDQSLRGLNSGRDTTDANVLGLIYLVKMLPSPTATALLSSHHRQQLHASHRSHLDISEPPCHD